MNEPVKLLEIINTEYGVTAEDGQKVYQVLYPLLQQGEVIVDFTGVNITASPFLNFAIGQLVKDCDISRLKFAGLSEYQQSIVNMIIQNAKNYYANFSGDRL